VVAPGEGQRQGIFGAPHRFIRADHRLAGVRNVMHLHTRTVGEEGGHVEALGNRIGRVPSVRSVLGRVENVAGLGTRGQDGLGRLHGVLPARLVAVRPDQYGLTLQRRPVGLVHGRIRPVHRGGGAHAGVDQGLGAFLALDQHDLGGVLDPRLVVQRPRLGRSHLAAARVPGPEFLLAPRRVVAVDDGDELPLCVEVVPLGGGGTQVVDRGLLGRLARRRRGRSADEVLGQVEDAGEVAVHVHAVVAADQVEHIAAGAFGAVGPQSRLVAVEHDFQAVPRAAEHVADDELAAALLSSGEQGEQHRLQPREQRGAHGLAAVGRRDLGRGCGVIEVQHPPPPRALRRP